MKKITLTICLIGLSIAVKAQNKKEYAQADPNKVYSFQLNIPAVSLDKLSTIYQVGSAGLMDTEIQAKQAKDINVTVGILVNSLFVQLRKQIMADSLANVKSKKR